MLVLTENYHGLWLAFKLVSLTASAISVKQINTLWLAFKLVSLTALTSVSAVFK